MKKTRMLPGYGVIQAGKRQEFGPGAAFTAFENRAGAEARPLRFFSDAKKDARPEGRAERREV